MLDDYLNTEKSFIRDFIAVLSRALQAMEAFTARQDEVYSEEPSDQSIRY